MVRRLIIAKSAADFTSHAGLGLIGMAISQQTDLAKDATAAAAARSDVHTAGQDPHELHCSAVFGQERL